MPDPARTRRAPTPNQATSANDNKPSGPLWARAVHHFYDPGFDIRSGKAFQGALNDFVALDPAERAFHETHLLYRLVLGLEGVYGLLRRIEQKLDQGGASDLSALGHLAPIRAALEEIASGQADLVQVSGLDEEDEEQEEDDELGEDEEQEEDTDGEDPDFIYDTVPEDEPEQPRHPRRPAQPEAPRPQAQRAEPPRPQRAADPEREALVGELVPASEGPQGEAGDR